MIPNSFTTSRRRHWLLVQLLVLASSVPGCSATPDAPETPEASDVVSATTCLDLLAQGDFERALPACGEEFEASADPAVGSAAAQAAFYLGQYDDVLGWGQELAGTEEEPFVLGFVAAAYRRLGQPDRAREASERSIEIYRAAADHAAISGVYYTLFRVAWADSDFRAALDELRRSYDEAQLAGDGVMQARAVQGLVSSLIAVGDLLGAERALQQAEQLAAADDSTTHAYLETWRGIIMAGGGRENLARNAFERSLDFSEASEDPDLLRQAHLNLVEISVRLGDVEQAEAHLAAAGRYPGATDDSTIAFHHFQAMVDNASGRYADAAIAARASLDLSPPADAAWETELELARAEEALGNREAAEEAYERAARHVETMRTSLGLDDLKSWLVDEKRHPYEGLFRMQAAAGRSEDALYTIERAKARTFLDALVSATSGVQAPSADLWVADGAVERADILTALLPRMSESPGAALRPIAEVLDAIEGTAFLVYFVAGEEVWSASPAEEGLQLRLLDASPQAIEQLVDRFLVRPDDRRVADELGAVLLPEGSLPEVGAHLHLVVDGSLGRLPFAALRRNGRALVQDYVISYVPSLNALAAIRASRRASYGRAVVLGDPRGDLAAAASEATEVARYLDVSPHIGATATTERLRDATTARLLHVATHTGLRATGPWLALADGDVGAGALIEARIGPRLVVLATCASGAREGMGMWGSLGAAFLAAGSEAVVASLWSIEDELARAFVTRFYEEGGADAAALALARTQRAFIAEGKPPSSWGPFVHFGSDRR